MIARARLLLVVMLAIVAGPLAGAQVRTGAPASAITPTDPMAQLAERVRNLDARLEALSPQRPREYLQLGEDIAGENLGGEALRLARTLMVLAYELDRTSPPERRDTGLGVSCLLALASVAGTDGDRRWLRAMARSMDDAAPLSLPAPGQTTAATAIEPGALQAASALGLARAGEGRKAARLLERCGAAQLLQNHERLLDPGELPGGYSALEKIIADWPTCPQCRGRRFTKDAQGVHLCKTCGGKPGPNVSEPVLVAHLRTEAALLSGVQRSWAAAALADGGAPLRDLDPDELALTLGVDKTRPLYRKGRWVAPEAPRPAASDPASTPKPDAKP